MMDDDRTAGLWLRQHLRLYLVMGSMNGNADPAYILREAIMGGITMFQFREKGPGALQGTARLELGKQLRSICGRYDIPFLVNDDVELALQLDADGIHIGQEDEPASKVRERMRDRIVGVSAHNMEEAEAALADGADYLGVGPMYPTRTKLDAQKVIGPPMVSSLRDGGINAPLVGIGGIQSSNAEAVIHARADGVAIISAISQASSPKEAACTILQKVSSALIHR
jgi:thiamine-phosphate pyrophosphorylase